MKIVTMILVICFFAGCKDVPYKEQETALNLDEAFAKNAAPIEKASAKIGHAPSGTDVPSRIVDHPAVRPIVEIENTDSGNRNSESSRRDSSHSNTPPPSLPPVVEEEVKNLSIPKVEITSPPNNSLMSTKHFEIKGSIEYPELIQNIMVRYRGLSEANILVAGEKSVNKTENNFSAMFDDLPDGDYGLSIMFVDINGIEHLLPDMKISIDSTPPKIFGALDAIAQPAYLQEDMQFEQKFIDEASNPRYEIVPTGEATPLKFESIPTISRWLMHLLDEKTAPTYAFKISDIDIADVKYAIDLECASFEKASHETVKKEDGRYEIKIIPSASDSNLNGKKFCLSIWATDLAGNKASHKAEFIWQILVPPVALDMNAARYVASRRRGDVSWADLPVRQLFSDTIPIALKRDLVVGHTIISNPFSSPLAIKLEMRKPLYLKVNSRHYSIPANNVVIQYFAYDVAKNEIGLEKPVHDGSAVIDGNETLAAQIILARDFPLTGVRHPKRSFWRSFSLEIGFSKSGRSDPIVDGLSLIARDSVAGLLSNEFVVPWGEEHEVRRKVAPKERGRR